MNAFQTILAAQHSHLLLLDELKEFSGVLGSCDHSVGVCHCALRRKIERGEEVQEELTALAARVEARVLSQPEPPLTSPPSPIEALRLVEHVLRHSDFYHIAVSEGGLGLGEFIKRVIAGGEK